MGGADRITAGDLVDRAGAAAPLPPARRGTENRVVQLKPQFKRRVREKVSGQNSRRHYVDREVVNDHHAGDRGVSAGDEGTAHFYRTGGHGQSSISLGKG